MVTLRACSRVVTIAIALTACATAPGPDGGRGYGLEWKDAREAVGRGEGRQALAYYERAAAEFERRGRRLDAARAHTAASFVAKIIGAYQVGIRSGRRALELLEALHQTDEILMRRGIAYESVGWCYLWTGDLQEAERHFQAGLALARRRGNWVTEIGHSAWFLGNLAQLALRQGNPSQAVRYGDEAIDHWTTYLSRLSADSRLNAEREVTRRQLAFVLVRTAVARRQLGDLPAAEANLRRALETGRAGYGAEDVERSANNGLGWTMLQQRQAPAALNYFRAALSLATRQDKAPDMLTALSGIGWSEFWTRRFEEALRAFRRSADLAEDMRSGLTDVGLRQGFLEDKQGVYNGGALSAAELGRADEAFGFAERGRARAFLDLLGDRTTLSKGRTRALVEEEVRIRTRLAQASAVAAGAAGRDARRAMDAVEREYRAFLERVRKDSLEQASLMTVEPLTLAQVQALIPDGTTLLEYLVTGESGLAWVIDRTRAEMVRLSVSRDELVAEVRSFRELISERAALTAVADHAQRLSERLLRPVAPYLRGERLLILPHDVLHYLPFAALRTEDGQWLAARYTLATLPSASVLKHLGDKGAGASGATLALGNPELGPELTLRYAEREARAVAERLPDTTLLVRGDATEARAKALSAAAGVLHFATHAELSEREPLSSALLLVPGGGEDGRLEVREIFGLDLNARLVVLSACETGLGRLSRGDELVGLQRAFLYAGTAAVVTTLWKVDDRASYELMREFYAALAGEGPAAALALAQRRSMREAPHPFFWAAFTLTGVPR